MLRNYLEFSGCLYTHFIYVLSLKFIFVAKWPYPTHFKILVVNTVGFETGETRIEKLKAIHS